jgi:hypothetical protein
MSKIKYTVTNVIRGVMVNIKVNGQTKFMEMSSDNFSKDYELEDGDSLEVVCTTQGLLRGNGRSEIKTLIVGEDLEYLGDFFHVVSDAEILVRMDVPEMMTEKYEKNDEYIPDDYDEDAYDDGSNDDEDDEDYE